jgi:hypothetical protein
MRLKCWREMAIATIFIENSLLKCLFLALVYECENSIKIANEDFTIKN